MLHRICPLKSSSEKFIELASAGPPKWLSKIGPIASSVGSLMVWSTQRFTCAQLLRRLVVM